MNHGSYCKIIDDDDDLHDILNDIDVVEDDKVIVVHDIRGEYVNDVETVILSLAV